MPLPSEPKVMGDTVAAKEYGARVKPDAPQKASAAKSAQPTKSAKPKKVVTPAAAHAAAAKKPVKKAVVKNSDGPLAS